MQRVQLKVADFQYTKPSGEVSDRKLLVISGPSDSYFGLEVDNDLTPVSSYLKYIAELREVEEQLKIKHGLADAKLPYKRFKANGVSQLNESQVDVYVELD